MGRGGSDSEMSFCFRGSPRFEQRRAPGCAKYESDGFEFQTCRRFIPVESTVRENKKGGYDFSGRPVAYADDLFLNGRILPLKLKLPPCKQGSWGTGTPVPSPSPRLPLSPGAAFSFSYESGWNDDMGIDPFMIALENIKCDRKRTDLDDDSDFNKFESTRSSRCRVFEPRGVEFARKLRLARLAEEMKQTGTEAVIRVPKRRRIRNFLSRSKRTVLRKLRIGGSSGSTVNVAPIQRVNRMAVVKYTPNKILLCLGYGGEIVKYL